ncbi:MAG: restriction endonuclease subunit S [Candidatus Kapabacteria bacterium]|nr:restriction endonuclease subunit S [Ignavibacteriota bacterium]MCW5884897.1 restriction endonuclease subunit S [Candidatus Kapabacteria bacterium]
MSKWEKVKLKDIIEFTISGEWGYEPKQSEFSLVLRSTNFTDFGVIDYSDIASRFVPESILNKKRIKKGYLLVEKSGGSDKKPAGRVVYCDKDFEGTCSNFIEIVKINDKYDSKYILYFFLNNYHSGRLNKYQQQTTGIINFKFNEYLEEFCFLPIDKSIQSRIAEILTTADKAIEESEKLIAKYKRMKTGMMQDLLTKGIDENGNIRSEATHKFKDSPLGRIPVEWEVKRLEEVCIYVSDGSHFSPKAREEGFVIGNVKDMEEFDFNYNSCTKISIRDYEVLVSQNCQPLKGDILLSKDGTIGKVFVFNKDKKIVILSSIAILRPSDKYSSLYLSYLLKSQYFNKNLIKFISGSALKRIVIRDIKKMIFPLSSDEREQNRICDYLSEIDSLVFVETETLSKLKRLKAGLMNDLLSGKVEVVDN